MTPPRLHDLEFMRLALAEAERGRGQTRPNPLVGAVIVDESGPSPRLLATGFHARAGTDHAEVAALRSLGGQAPGATLYVTLEPCNHVGRTGNCCEALLRAGLRRVVVGMRDPNPRVPGGGVERLRQAGVAVEVGVLEEECRRQNRGYLRWITTGRPHLILKAAVSLDGFLAPPPQQRGSGGPVWLTGEAARARAHMLRAGCDALLIGAGTVRSDDPQLTVRLPEWQGPQPLRVVLDGQLSLRVQARVCQPGTLICTSEQALRAHPERVAALRDRGVEVVALPPAKHGGRPTDVDLEAVVELLGRREVLTALCEGGAELHGALLSAGLYQEAALFVAPVLLGAGVPLARGFATGPSGLRLAEVSVEVIGQDVLVQGLLPEGAGGGHVHRDH
ncbi:MAG: bifunctional diaminohydroxyphosphoribosylaminopyrimidine deaminase/5-amino-6-(5-phosphoribosylamino)uracil reductase RibD [Myxococcales bacterium]|nr:bifunctional diaminohydroxyphosphoribosylaminopyrimidine deaminase/5-amino-6-(5-phosphoribosylamino)uracil reductase RibD [Myxococcota bacterium]MDW8280474.1 bifunctional diaminohydroxyphosphoribosylaminopyrimidine deaminase/5-amino-6-(5-phosphoribosylamino)uracil reductase RibD [Myxococcales bacterium]